VSSIEEHITGGLQAWEYCEKKLFSGCESVLLGESLLVWPEPPLIDEWKGGCPIAEFVRVPTYYSGAVGTSCLVFSISSEGVYLEIFLTTYPYMMSHLWDH
jgi:hypothetical protein